MQHVFWLKKGKIAGRSGPNRDTWDLSEFKLHGIESILSVNDGEGVHEAMLATSGITYSNIPMSSNAPVRHGDKEFCLRNLPKAMDFIRKTLPSGPVLIHCRSGKDRTGMVMAAYLIEFESYSPIEAMEEVRAIRPIAFSAEGWMEFAQDVLSQFETQKNAYKRSRAADKKC